jgi:hypothetical protein
MKKLILLSALFFSIQAWAGDDKYYSMMQQNLASLDTCKTTTSLQLVANKFERIYTAMSESDWLAPYYASLSYVMMTFVGKEKDAATKDSYLDKAQALLDKIKAKKSSYPLAMDESEIMVLQGYIQQARLIVDPPNRGRQYGPLQKETFEKAKKLNPENPRVYYLSGQNIFYTPAMWGGGKDKACPILKVAAEKYKAEKTMLASKNTPEYTIVPKWGSDRTDLLLKECEK